MHPQTVLGLLVALVTSPLTSAQNCAATPTGFVPIPDLLTGTYLGSPGGLYPNSSNSIPPTHLADGLAEAAEVKPRDAAGAEDCNGRVVVVSLGMSLTRQTFGAWREQFSDQDANRSPDVMLVNGTVGGQTSSHWASGFTPGGVDIWQSVQDRVTAAGVTAEQVQVAFIYMVSEHIDPFPIDATKFKSDIETIVQRARAEFPRCRLAYLTSAHYFGYSTSPDPARHEPYAYEDGFGVKWLIEDQIGGSNPNLSFKAAGGIPKAPWLAWAPYLWADGTTMQGALWECDDFVSDGIHLTPKGQDKLAPTLDSYFTTESTTIPWYLPSGTCSPPPVSLAFRYGDSCEGTGSKSPNVFADLCQAPCSSGTTLTNSLPYSGNADFRIRVSGILPNNSAVLALSYAPDPLDALSHSQANSTCGVLVSGSASNLFALETVVANSNGSATHPFAIPSNPTVVGLEFYAQWFSPDSLGTLTLGGSRFSASRGMNFRVGVQ